MRAAKTSPPKARIAFRVGVVGHRPDRLPEPHDQLQTLQGRIFDVLGYVKQAVTAFHAKALDDARFYGPETPLLRAVSPLAEGGDRMFARAALDHGYGLCCPMPLPKAEYEKDFVGSKAREPDSLSSFHGLLDRAERETSLVVFELDGQRHDEDVYGPAGRLVLNQSDLLIAIWDGGKARGRGGTPETLREALQFRVPVLWLDARSPFGWRILRKPADLDALERTAKAPKPKKDKVIPPLRDVADTEGEKQKLAKAIADLVTSELALPPKVADEEPAAAVAAYFSESQRRFNCGFLWKPFRDLVGLKRLTAPPFLVPEFLSTIIPAWPTAGDPPELRDAAQPPPSATASWANGVLRGHYAWSDKVADLMADFCRSTFVVTGLLAPFAVLLALAPMAFGITEQQPQFELWFILSELVILAVIIFLVGHAQRRGWRRKWLEYRVLAELIRQLRLMIPLGGGRPLPRAALHLKVYGDPSLSWMYWQVRAIAREAGLPAVAASPEYLRECLNYLKVTAVDSQGGFHAVTAERCGNINSRLHKATLFLFWATLIAIAAHFGLTIMAWLGDPGPDPLPDLLERFRRFSGWLVLSSAFLPAMGSGLASINNQGEFGRLHKRSLSMKSSFEGYSAEIDGLISRLDAKTDTLRLADVTDFAARMAATMVDEVSDWRVVVQDLPHVADDPVIDED